MEQFKIYHAASPVPDDMACALLDLMELSFPGNERRERPRQQLLFTHPLYRIFTVEEEGRLMGFMSCWTMRDYVYVEHLAVSPEARNRGTGGRLVDWVQKALNRPLVLEVEMPEDELTKRRVSFYERHGFRLNDHSYLQMPYRESDSPMPMKLMSWPDALTEEKFRAFRLDVYREVYQVKEAELRKFM